MKCIEISYCVNECNTQRYQPTDEAEALHTVVQLIGKFYREQATGNSPHIEITETEETE